MKTYPPRPRSPYDVSHVTNMQGMFDGTLISDITPLAGWDVSSVTSMQSMFGECPSLANVSPLAAWNVANVTDMQLMFYGCEALSDATPLNSWTASSSGTNVSGMFQGCAAGIKTPTWYKG